MVEKYKLIEHTADTGILAHGNTIEEAFENSARGMFSIIASPENVDESEAEFVSISSSDRESLLVDWLNELIFRFDTMNILFERFVIIEMGEFYLKARIYGQKIDRSIHEVFTGIKAATFHQLKIDHNGGYTVQVYFDV